MPRRLATLTKWVTLATAATALFFVVGPDNGQWQEPEVQAMVADLPGAMKKYALCNNCIPSIGTNRARVISEITTYIRLCRLICVCAILFSATLTHQLITYSFF